MYLKKLDLIGFKSFADPTTVTFQSGITVIVGPNGCGKSNIVDAVLWVLGEQSTKALRSDKMEDVIFNGSESRKPISMSEVVLTVGGVTPEQIGNQFGEFEELSLCRRLFRSGDSEYLINRIPCRLRDIRDVLIDTGAGHKGHTIIEQGKVDQLLNASPKDRRGLIEETAGITKYNIRKAEAERKLDSTEQNLLRVRDIVSEVRRQIQGLDRQVKKTELYNSLRIKAQSLEAFLLVDEFQTIDTEFREVNKNIAGKQEEESSSMARLSSLDAEVQNAKTEVTQEEQVVAGLRQQTYDLQTQIQRQENRIELLNSQITSWEDHRNRLVQERGDFELARGKGIEEQGVIEQQKQSAAQTIEQLKGKIENKETENRGVEESVTQGTGRHEANKTRLFDLLAEMTEAKNLSAASTSRHVEILRSQEKSQAELAGVLKDLIQAQISLEKDKTFLGQLETTVTETVGNEKRLSKEIEEHQAQLSALDQRLKVSREELTRQEARLASSKEQARTLMVAHESLHEKLQDHSDLLDRFSGVVADVMSVSREYEKAIEAAMGDRLQALIAEDHLTIRSALEHFKSRGTVRGVFIPRTLRMKPGFSGLSVQEGIIGPAIRFVEARPGFENLVQAMLGGVIIVEDLEKALNLWSQQPIAEILVTLDGEVVYPSGMVVTGHSSNGEHGFLQTRRKIAEMELEVQQRRSQLDELEGERTEQKARVDQLTSDHQEMVEKQHRGEIDATAQREKVVALDSEMSRLLQHQLILQNEAEQRTRELHDLEASIQQSRVQIEGLEVRHNELQQLLSTDQEELSRLEENRRTLSEELTQLKVEMTSFNERQDLYIREEERLQKAQVDLTEKIQERESESEGLVSRIETARRDRKETEIAITTLAGGLSESEKALGEKTQVYTDHLNHIKELEEELSRVRGQWGRVEQELKGLELRQTELKTKLDYTRVQLKTSYEKTPEDVLSTLGPESIDRESTRTELKATQAKMDQIGPVNLAAPEEYRELEQRYEFLTTQESDLTRSIQDLQKAIQKINKTTRELFLSAYTALRAKFAEVFQKFFEGGQADLILEDEDNPLDSGVEIVAQPPGKRLRHISLLSGGEKALTAISLLFASFLIHPSPFCILDEIDAPLDEENTRRFLQTLTQMVDHSQFLVITHNKRTMEQANILYGVTMEEPGVSKLVSVKLGSAGNGTAKGDPSVQPVGSSSTIS